MTPKKGSIFKVGRAGSLPPANGDEKPAEPTTGLFFQILFSDGGLSLLVVLPIVLVFYLKLALDMYS